MYINKHQNINRLLESSARTDLFGKNMASIGQVEIYGRGSFRPDVKRGGNKPESQWQEQKLGMHGIFVLGHHTPVSDALSVFLTVDGKEIGTKENPLFVTRNHWTPAYTEAVYRAPVDEDYYKRSASTVIYEKKTISYSDVYNSFLTIKNEKRETSHVFVRIAMPFEEYGEFYRIETETTAAAMRVQYKISGYAFVACDRGSRELELEIPPFSSVTVKYSMAYDKDASEAKRKARKALECENPFLENEKAFNAWFDENVPVFKCDDSDVLKVYYYRYYLLYRSIYMPSEVIPEHKFKASCMYESQFGTWYGTVVDLPVPLQIEEAKWLSCEKYGRDQTEVWTLDGEKHSTYIHFTPFAVWDFYRVHPDREWLLRNYKGLLKSVEENFDIDAEYPIRATNGSWPTGAEYQPSFYQYTEEKWDYRHDVEGNRSDGLPIQRVFRVDTLGYDILSLRALRKMANELGKVADAERFSRCEEKLKKELLSMWDEEKKFFFDRDEKTGLLADEAKCFDGFVPFIDGIVGKEYYVALEKIWSENEFSDVFSVTTASKDCPMYWWDNCITGPAFSSEKSPKTYGACWNGPVWPFANSLVALALGDTAKSEISDEMKSRWLSFFGSFTELHFPYGDRSTPLMCEHYRADDGASFSPINDYFHSSWINPFMTYWAGIDVSDGVRFSPFTDREFSLYGVKIGEKSYHFEQRYENGEKLLFTKEI